MISLRLVAAVSLVNSTTPYVYDLRTQTYSQPGFAYQMLQRTLTVNSAALGSLVTEKMIEMEKRDPLPAGTPLSQLIDIGMKDQTLAPTVLSELMEALGTQRQWVAKRSTKIPALLIYPPLDSRC